jgi:hypothetical protein
MVAFTPLPPLGRVFLEGRTLRIISGHERSRFQLLPDPALRWRLGFLVCAPRRGTAIVLPQSVVENGDRLAPSRRAILRGNT